jgi:aerobic-type carbon monoxide dehydrogenase small subunit (CoxS/CutS family)
MATLQLRINEHSYTVDTDPQASLLTVLREQLDLTGSKYGCGEGQCGACTVLIDGKAQRSCITPAGAVAKKQITTIEGLARGSELHPVQQAFLDEEAMQCAYCTSGMIMSAVALLRTNPAPRESEIIDFMDGNICRCGTYSRIIRAIQKAARVLSAAGPGLQGSDPDPRLWPGSANHEGPLAVIATQTAHRGAEAPPGPSLGKQRLAQDYSIVAAAGKGAAR